MLVAGCLSLRTPLGGVVVLVDVLDGEIRNVDVGVQTRFERSAYVTELFPHDTSEEWVAFDLDGAIIFALVAETVGSVAEQAIGESASYKITVSWNIESLSDQVLCFTTEVDVFWEI